MNPVNIDKGRFRKFGRYYKDAGWHVGHDFDCPIGTEVFAVDDGIIIFSGQVNGFGSMNPHSPGGVIIIQHENYCTLYGHIKRDLKKDSKVKKGDKIGEVAEFRNQNFLLPHLHFGKYEGEGLPKTKWGYVKKEDDVKKWLDPLK